MLRRCSTNRRPPYLHLRQLSHRNKRVPKPLSVSRHPLYLGNLKICAYAAPRNAWHRGSSRAAEPKLQQQMMRVEPPSKEQER